MRVLLYFAKFDSFIIQAEKNIYTMKELHRGKGWGGWAWREGARGLGGASLSVAGRGGGAGMARRRHKMRSKKNAADKVETEECRVFIFNRDW